MASSIFGLIAGLVTVTISLAQPVTPSDPPGSLTAMAGEPVTIAAPGAATASTGSVADPEQLLALYSPNGTAQSVTTTDELDFVLGHRQIFTDLRTLQDRINNAQRPTFNAVGRHSFQSDDLVINQAEVSQDLFFENGRSQLRLGLQAIDYNPLVGRGVSQYAAGVTGHYRINELAAFTGEFWLNQLRSRSGSDTDATYDAFLTLRPSDTLRFDLNTSRRLFDNVKSLEMGLTTTSYGGSVDFTPMDSLRLTVRGAYGLYSDGNRRRSEEVEGIWRIKSQPIVEIGLRGTNFHFLRLLDNGYFNPSDFYSGEAMFRLEWVLTKKLTIELAGSGGIEYAEPGGTKPLIKGSLQLAYKLSERLSLDGDVSHFSSSQSSSSGFSRTTATLGLHYRF